MSDCGALYDDYDGTCQLEAGHDGSHSEGALEWDAEPIDFDGPDGDGGWSAEVPTSSGADT